VALVRTDVSEEPGASFIRVTKIGELGTAQAATSNRRTLRKSSQSSQLNTAKVFAAYVGCLCVYDVCTSQEKHFGFPRPVMGISHVPFT
jgi:hypothetical protein